MPVVTWLDTYFYIIYIGRQGITFGRIILCIAHLHFSASYVLVLSLCGINVEIVECLLVLSVRDVLMGCAPHQNRISVGRAVCTL